MQPTVPLSKSPVSTRVVGYFNGNEYPLRLNLSQFNVALDLRPAQYVVLGGKKINDPLFEEYAGLGMLSREMVPEDQAVPITYFRPAPTANIMATANGGVLATTELTRDRAGNLVPHFNEAKPGQPGQAQPFATGSNMPVVAMSVEEARTRGLLGGGKVLRESPVSADASVGSENVNAAPDLADVHYDATPGTQMPEPPAVPVPMVAAPVQAPLDTIQPGQPLPDTLVTVLPEPILDEPELPPTSQPVAENAGRQVDSRGQRVRKPMSEATKKKIAEGVKRKLQAQREADAPQPAT